jgi:hypothetical protein
MKENHFYMYLHLKKDKKKNKKKQKTLFSRTSRSISIKFGTNHPWVKGIQRCSNKGPWTVLFKGNTHKNAKMGQSHIEIFFSRTTRPENLRFT